LSKAEKMMPKVVKKRRKLDDDSFEEYFDYLFADDGDSNEKMLNLLKKAQEWKARLAANGQS
jgi:crooked neck